MDYLSRIKAPIEGELALFNDYFCYALSHADGLLAQALGHIARRKGKRIRPMLVLLLAKSAGGVSEATLNVAVGLELLHTASLVHDDVVDESDARRGQPSVNASYNNKVAVLVGDYLLSSALLSVARADNGHIVEQIAALGQTLAGGEILQLSTIGSDDISEDTYYKVVQQKTASFFEACCVCGILSAGGTHDDKTEAARRFGRDIGMMFQIRDDIFDYYPSADIGKPTGNDMAEGKLTLPALYAIAQSTTADVTTPNGEPSPALTIARKIKTRQATTGDIAWMVDYSKQQGGIDYAVRRMHDFHAAAQEYITANVTAPDIQDALKAYIDFVVERSK